MDFQYFLEKYLKIFVNEVSANRIESAYKQIRGIEKSYRYGSHNSYAMGVLHGCLEMVGIIRADDLVEKLWVTDIYALPMEDEPGFEESVNEWGTI